METSKGFAPNAAMKSAARTGLELRKKHKQARTLQLLQLPYKLRMERIL